MFFVSTSNITKLFDKNNSYSFEYQKNSYFILGCAAVVQEGNIRKTMAARGLVNGRGPRSGRDLVFRCYPPELLLTPQKKKLTFWVSLFYNADVETSKAVLKACYEGGVRAFEFTNRGDFAQEVFGELVKYANKELPGMIMGIGSVVDPATAAMYLQLGETS